MTPNASQKQFVKEYLIQYGQISRNFCLSKYISRLGSYICLLQKEGMVIDAKYVETARGKDYVYYYRPNGQKTLI